MLRLVMPQRLTIVVDVVAWGVFHAATGYAAHRLGDRAARRATGGCCGERPLRGPAAGGTAGGCASTAGRTGCPRPAPSSRAASASASCPRATPTGLRALRPRDPPRRAGPLVGAGVRAALRAVEPAAGRGAARRLRRAGQPAVHRHPALQPLPDPGPARARSSAGGAGMTSRATARPATRRRGAEPRRDRRGLAARPDRPAADRVVAAQRDPGRLLAGAVGHRPARRRRRRRHQPARREPARARARPAPTRRCFGDGPHASGCRSGSSTAPRTGTTRWPRSSTSPTSSPSRWSPPSCGSALRDRFRRVGGRRARRCRWSASPATSPTRPRRRGWPPERGDIGDVDRISHLGWDVPRTSTSVGRLVRGRARRAATRWPRCRRCTPAPRCWSRCSSGRRSRGSRASLLAAYALAMALTLVYTGEHYVVDVLAGWAVAVARRSARRSWSRGLVRVPVAGGADMSTRPGTGGVSTGLHGRGTTVGACAVLVGAAHAGPALAVTVLAGLLAVAQGLDPATTRRAGRGRARRPAVRRLEQRPRRPSPATARRGAPTSRSATGDGSVARRAGARARSPSSPASSLSLALGPARRARAPGLRRLRVGLQPRAQGHRVVVAALRRGVRRADRRGRPRRRRRRRRGGGRSAPRSSAWARTSSTCCPTSTTTPRPACAGSRTGSARGWIAPVAAAVLVAATAVVLRRAPPPPRRCHRRRSRSSCWRWPSWSSPAPDAAPSSRRSRIALVDAAAPGGGAMTDRDLGPRRRRRRTRRRRDRARAP